MNKHILIIEDDMYLRTSYQMALEIEGYGVSVVENGHEALVELEAKTPDLILLDLLMPTVGGIDFLRTTDIKQRFPNTKVVVFSNLSDSKVIDKARELGADDYILKSSLTPRQLSNKIADMLGVKGR